MRADIHTTRRLERTSILVITDQREARQADDRPRAVDVVVIGGGQAGLAAGYYLRRTGLDFVILDAGSGPGGAWRETWDSLTLFSPARWSSLPGSVMPGGIERFPGRDQVVAYLTDYERRYRLPLVRPVTVERVLPAADGLAAVTDRGAWRARAVISATGTWGSAVIPHYPGQERFLGEQLHASGYRTPLAHTGQRVLVVGGGNSGAQIMAEVSALADATWVTRRPPSFLPDDVDGRVLFERATSRYQRGQAERPGDDALRPLGEIVMLPAVREARERGDLVAVRPFAGFSERGVIWPDGRAEAIDVVIWATGFRPALGHVASLDLYEPDGRIAVRGTRSLGQPRLWLLGYGNWTGWASATIAGVGRAARATVEEIAAVLEEDGRCVIEGSPSSATPCRGT
ncbi:MAG TPA: ArsO family NAD(P)H-dependent flavin-containing monooxygenase [Candidatus Limnocylindria bacterium]|nr:ArsO family NAD(P)H-dependent flavin-containing monooxygenase [Candidatus Limnocylindria bacterium]